MLASCSVNNLPRTGDVLLAYRPNPNSHGASRALRSAHHPSAVVFYYVLSVLWGASAVTLVVSSPNVTIWVICVSDTAPRYVESVGSCPLMQCGLCCIVRIIGSFWWWGNDNTLCLLRIAHGEQFEFGAFSGFVYRSDTGIYCLPSHVLFVRGPSPRGPSLDSPETDACLSWSRFFSTRCHLSESVGQHAC